MKNLCVPFPLVAKLGTRDIRMSQCGALEFKLSTPGGAEALEKYLEQKMREAKERHRERVKSLWTPLLPSTEKRSSSGSNNNNNNNNNPTTIGALLNDEFSNSKKGFHRRVAPRGRLANWLPCAMIPISEFQKMFLGNYSLAVLPELEGMLCFGRMIFTTRLTVKMKMAVAIAPPATVRHFNDVAQMYRGTSVRSIVSLKGQLECWVVEPAGNIVRPDSTVESLLSALFKLQQDLLFGDMKGEEEAASSVVKKESTNDAAPAPFYVVSPPVTEKWERREAENPHPELVHFLTIFVDQELFARAVGLTSPHSNHHHHDHHHQYGEAAMPQLVDVFVALRVFEWEVIDDQALVKFEVVRDSLFGSKNDGDDDDDDPEQQHQRRRIQATFPIELLFLARCSISEYVPPPPPPPMPKRPRRAFDVDADADIIDDEVERGGDDDDDFGFRRPAQRVTKRDKFAERFAVVAPYEALPVQIPREVGVGIGDVTHVDLHEHAEELEAEVKLQTMRNYAKASEYSRENYFPDQQQQRKGWNRQRNR